MSEELLTPRTINVQAYSDTHAKVALEPLERGFGHTLGNCFPRLKAAQLPKWKLKVLCMNTAP
jgi:DNA-directed RNA polymerase subunit alpha